MLKYGYSKYRAVNETFNNIMWSFTNTEFFSADVFANAVIKFTVNNGFLMSRKYLDKIVLDESEILVVYKAWVSNSSLLKNEKLFEDTCETKNELDRKERKIIAYIKSDNGKNFTALELLMKINNQLANKNLKNTTLLKSLKYENRVYDTRSLIGDKKKITVLFLECKDKA